MPGIGIAILTNVLALYALYAPHAPEGWPLRVGGQTDAVQLCFRECPYSSSAPALRLAEERG